MARRLIEMVSQEELQAEQTEKVRKRAAVHQIASNDGSKDKQISAKVNEQLYSTFTQINKIQGLSNNSVINQLIYKYVRENRGVLEDLE